MTGAAKRKTERARNDGPGDGQLPPYAPYLILAALTLVFFWTLFSPTSRHWLWEDVLYFTHPARMFAAYCISLGQVPFWNPFVFGGQPFFADIQTAVLYPFNLLHSLLTSTQSGGYLLLETIEVFHYFLAAAFTFRFLRLTGANQNGSLIGAVAFAFSGYLVTHVIHTNFVFVFVWLPLVLELFERALTSGKFRFAVACAAVLAISIAGGYPQFTLYMYYTLALYWLVFELFARSSGDWSIKAALGRVLLLGFIAGVALGINLISWLPAAELAKYTPRSEMTYQASVEHSMEPWMLFKLIAPRIFGAQAPGVNNYWIGSYGSFWETCLFVGVLPLGLAVYCLRFFKRNRHIAFAAALTVLCLWLALGKYGLLYKLFFYCAPGFGEFRHPGRFSGIVSFGLASLAAYGWTMLVSAAQEKRTSIFRNGPGYVIVGIAAAIILVMVWASNWISDRTIATIAGRASFVSAGWVLLGMVVLWLAWQYRQNKALALWLGIAACLVSFAELYWFGTPSLAGRNDPAEFYSDNQFVQQYRQEGKNEIFRVSARSLEHPRLMTLKRNQGSIDHLFLIEGYNPLQLERRLKDVEKKRQFDLSNVKYEISVDMQRRKVWMQQRQGYLPRAFLAGKWRVVEGDERILATLNDPGFDYKREVVLEKAPGMEIDTRYSADNADAEIVKYSPGEIVVRATCGGNALLVLSEWSYPAWKATVDGQAAEILRADYALRAVALAPGEHDVRFAYDSGSFHQGLTISLISLGLLLVSALVSFKFGRF